MRLFKTRALVRAHPTDFEDDNEHGASMPRRQTSRRRAAAKKSRSNENDASHTEVAAAANDDDERQTTNARRLDWNELESRMRSIESEEAKARQNLKELDQVYHAFQLKHQEDELQLESMLKQLRKEEQILQSLLMEQQEANDLEEAVNDETNNDRETTNKNKKRRKVATGKLTRVRAEAAARLEQALLFSDSGSDDEQSDDADTIRADVSVYSRHTAAESSLLQRQGDDEGSSLP